MSSPAIALAAATSAADAAILAAPASAVRKAGFLFPSRGRLGYLALASSAELYMAGDRGSGCLFPRPHRNGLPAPLPIFGEAMAVSTAASRLTSSTIVQAHQPRRAYTGLEEAGR